MIDRLYKKLLPHNARQVGCQWRTPRLSRRAKFLLLFLLPLTLLAAPASAQSSAKEYEVKAAFLLNFAQYIEWPPAAFTDAATPFTVGVLGEDPFGDMLEQTFQEESINGRTFVIKRSRSVDELKSSHLLFICASEKERLGEILGQLGSTSAVTISEIDKFAQQGGVVNFYLDNKRVRFEINPDAAQQKGLKISSELLKRARIVRSDSGKAGE